MKVLIWTQYFWPETFHINHVVTELRNQGVDVTVLTGKPNYPDGVFYSGYRAQGIQTEYHDGIEIIRLPIRARGESSAKGLMLNYLSFIASGYVLGPWALRGRKFDLVFVYAPSPLLQALPAIFVSWVKRAPLLLWVQDIWPEVLHYTGFINNRLIIKFIEFVVRYIYRYSDSILIQSEGFRNSVQRLSSDKEKIKYFPNSAFQDQGNRNYSFDLSGISGFFSVVFAGNIGSAQSCETIVEAAKILREYKFIRFFLVGGGSMEKKIAQMIHNEQLDNIELFGRVSQEDIGSIYAVSSVLLLTLCDDQALSSTVPSKFQSYLAAGKPIIASCNGQVAQILADAEAGLSCVAENSLQLSEAVLELFNSEPERLKKMGDNARVYFNRYYALSSNIRNLVQHFQCMSKK